MKTLSIVIPVYNEETRLPKAFSALAALRLARGLKLERVIFVDDGSDDASHFMLDMERLVLQRKLRKQYPAARVQIVSYDANRGKGYAVAQGLTVSSSDYTLICDADMSTPFTQISKFAPAMAQDIPIIVGTRKNGHSTVVVHQPLYRELLGRGFTLLSQLILNLWVTDFTCGFKAFSREAKEAIVSLRQIDRWGYDPELLFIARLGGFAMVEVPVVWSNDRRSRVSLWKDLPRSFVELLQIRVAHARGQYGPRLISSSARVALQAATSLKTLLV